MSDTAATILRIGPFAHLARVTIKTLRFYEAAGLFRPLRVDPVTGYRYYRTDQLPELRWVRLLRELGCPVAEIRGLLSQPHGSQAHLQQLSGLRSRLMVRVALAEANLRRFDRLFAHTGSQARLHSDAADSSPGSQRRIPSTLVYSIRERVRASGSEIPRMFELAERRVAREGLRAVRSPFLLFHDMDYHRPFLDVEVCVPVSRGAAGMEGVRAVEEVPRAQCIRFAGEYSQAPLLFDAALERMQRAGTRIAGPVREVYLRFGAEQRGYRLPRRMLAERADEFRTELQIPVTRV